MLCAYPTLLLDACPSVCPCSKPSTFATDKRFPAFGAKINHSWRFIARWLLLIVHPLIQRRELLFSSRFMIIGVPVVFRLELKHPAKRPVYPVFFSNCNGTLPFLPHQFSFHSDGYGEGLISSCLTVSFWIFLTCAVDKPCSIFPPLLLDRSFDLNRFHLITNSI